MIDPKPNLSAGRPWSSLGEDENCVDGIIKAGLVGYRFFDFKKIGAQSAASLVFNDPVATGPGTGRSDPSFLRLQSLDLIYIVMFCHIGGFPVGRSVKTMLRYD